ncbi:uncharacterized protein [Sinocyclocheilus grahami]|uniref:uncharacterized protein n=1 Tax=Sinocyclocheilus grahami TaxID=75366 RepID=UPI0007ACBE7E|nr:PREDICTED: uncharacterized protein LOC107569777 [Sinocyclocheilus grahami]
MVISCAYPGCFNIKKPKRKFSPEKKILTFHRFPIHNPERLKLWLLALHLDINTPEHTLIFKRVCSDHFFDHDFKPSQQRKSPFSERVGCAQYVFTANRGMYIFFYYIRCINVFFSSMSKDNDAELEEVQGAGVFLANVPQSTPAKHQDSGPGTTTRQFADAKSKLCLVLTSPESVGKRTKPSTSGTYYALPAIHSHQSPPVYNQPEQTEEQFEESLELDVSMLSIDPPSDKKDLSFQPLSSTSTSAPSTEDEECEMHWKQIKWIVNEPNVMELFKRCQECGSVITKTRKATVGSVLRVHWECEKNHKGKWSSCTDVRGMPANNLLVSLLMKNIKNNRKQQLMTYICKLNSVIQFICLEMP